MRLKDEFLEALNKFALRNRDLDNCEILFACLTLMGHVVPNMKDPHRRQNAIDDVNWWSAKMMQVAARIAEGDAKPTEDLHWHRLRQGERTDGRTIPFADIDDCECTRKLS